MKFELPSIKNRTSCANCPVRKLKSFRDFTSPELEFVSKFKAGEMSVEAGTNFLNEGAHSAHLFTVLSGWAFRYKMLEDGRRQILNYAMPADLLGLQGSIIGEMQHSVEALTPLVLCVFERDRINELYRKHPGLAYDLTWMAAREERILDEHLLSIGRRTAIERAAYLLSYLQLRSKVSGPLASNDNRLPITQQHVADTLGLSIVHTNKTLKKLSAKGLIKWLDRGCVVLDVDGLLEISGWKPEPTSGRPFI
jgi:CRP-like cAMP-binding protein